MSPELIGSVLAGLLTLMVFSTLLGANPLSRLAQHLFVGVSLGYAGVIALDTVLLPRAAQALTPGGLLSAGVPFVLGLLLLLRLAQPASSAGALALNIVTVTAAGLALGGILMGTLLPQLAATMLSVNPANVSGGVPGVVNNLIIVVGVIAVLYYFSFGVRSDGTRGPLSAAVAGAGRWLLIASLGAVLGSLTVSFVAALLDRIQFLFGSF